MLPVLMAAITAAQMLQKQEAEKRAKQEDAIATAGNYWTKNAGNTYSKNAADEHTNPWGTAALGLASAYSQDQQGKAFKTDQDLKEQQLKNMKDYPWANSMNLSMGIGTNTGAGAGGSFWSNPGATQNPFSQYSLWN